MTTRTARRVLIFLAAALAVAVIARYVDAADIDALFADSFEGQCVTDCPPPPLTYCEQIAVDPLVQPAGRQGRIVPWSRAFYAAQFYTPTTYLHPIGSVTIGDLPQPGRWLAVAFTPDEATRVTLDWVEAQSLFYPIRYNGRPAHSAYVTVSPCPGDFRLADNASADGYLKRGCRRNGNIESIRFRADLAASSTSNCAVEPGVPHFLNVGFFEPGETDPQAHTCITGTRCEINVQPQ